MKAYRPFWKSRNVKKKTTNQKTQSVILSVNNEHEILVRNNASFR